jgi:hypothetical protein
MTAKPWSGDNGWGNVAVCQWVGLTCELVCGTFQGSMTGDFPLIVAWMDEVADIYSE